MMDRLWNTFVESMMVLFMPFVCFYYTICADLFVNLSAKNATGLESVANTLLAPTQYILAGKEAIETADGSWVFVQRFDYSKHFWFKVATSITALPASFVLGTASKALSFLSVKTRARYAAIRTAWESTKTDSNREFYQSLGLNIGETAELFTSQGHERRPGDELVLAEGKQALRDIGTLLDKGKIPWWVDCGTCLGAYRYGGIIPWDGDIDIAVLLPDFENVRRALNQLDQSKYIVQDWSSREHPQSYMKVYVRASGTLIDVYHFAILPETKELSYIFSLENNIFFPQWWKIRERRFKEPVAFDAVFPLKKGLFDGIEVYLPNNVEKYLQRYYGENLSPVRIYDATTGRYEKDLSHPYWLNAYVY